MWDKFLAQENSSGQGGIRTRDLSIPKPASYHCSHKVIQRSEVNLPLLYVLHQLGSKIMYSASRRS
ncbi:hypothetical protein DPMN_092270 [Dreissena polymorpha]|uniref:Uncharacterized protein n=1 Tax=Dreissena polymorpha TaxID=45954 RepID=A0A9D4L3M2_DREPO|nr:hypothetical protein DPMN_092270 [Dreissena polymorpha]